MHAILHEIGSTIHNTSSCTERAESLATGTQLFLLQIQMEAEHKVETPHAKQTRTRRI